MDCFCKKVICVKKYWIVRLLKTYKKKQCNAKVSFPQFSLWVSALSSHAPYACPCGLFPMLTARPMLSGVEDGIRAHEARPPHSQEKAGEAAFSAAFGWPFGGKLGFLIRLGGWERQLEKSSPSL